MSKKKTIKICSSHPIGTSSSIVIGYNACATSSSSIAIGRNAFAFTYEYFIKKCKPTVENIAEHLTDNDRCVRKWARKWINENMENK